MKNVIAALVVLLTGVFFSACTTVQVDKSYSPHGNKTKEVVQKNGKVSYELHRVFDSTLVEGHGRFKNKSESLARNTALNLAINDLAKKIGKVLSEEDSTIYNDDVRMFLRTRARNVVQGYSVVMDAYDTKTQTAEIVIRQEGERIASIMEKYIR